MLLWFQSYEKEAAARQLEVAELRKTGEAHRKRVKVLEQEVASQRIVAKVCPETTICAVHEGRSEITTSEALGLL